jgi:hypothetical protein
MIFNEVTEDVIRTPLSKLKLPRAIEIRRDSSASATKKYSANQFGSFVASRTGSRNNHPRCGCSGELPAARSRRAIEWITGNSQGIST